MIGKIFANDKKFLRMACTCVRMLKNRTFYEIRNAFFMLKIIEKIHYTE